MHIILKGPLFVEFQTCQSPSNKTTVTKTKDIKSPAKYLENPSFLRRPRTSRSPIK